jgi:hypothetical protein
MVMSYSLEMQKKAALELEQCHCPAVTEMMKDAKVMRDQSRACKG